MRGERNLPASPVTQAPGLPGVEIEPTCAQAVALEKANASTVRAFAGIPIWNGEIKKPPPTSGDR
jgi:hypothetical protein